MMQIALLIDGGKTTCFFTIIDHDDKAPALHV